MCTLLGTFKYTLTNGKQHRAGPLAATRACPAVAEDSSLLRHQVILEGLDQQILALRVVTHQQLRVHVAHQKVPPQQRQPHALHQLTERERERCMLQPRCATAKKTEEEGNLTQGTCCLRPSISCFTQLNTARYTSSSEGTLRLSLEIRSKTWFRKQV